MKTKNFKSGDKVNVCLDDVNWEKGVVCGVYPESYNVITLGDEKVHDRVNPSRIERR